VTIGTDRLMLAIVRHRYGSPGVLTLDRVPVPVPAPGEALVRVAASSLNTADLDILTGRPWLTRVGTGFRRPRRPGLGLDVAGVVVEVGSGVDGLVPGDRVWGDVFAAGGGAFAGYVVGPARVFSRLPDAVGFETAAALPHSAVLALQGLSARGGVRAGQRVLVNGAGGCVGPFAVQIAKGLGAEVTGVDRGGKLDLLRAAGADHVIDYTRLDCTRTGLRYDFVLDIAARGATAFRRVLESDGAYVQIARTLGGFIRTAVVGAAMSAGSHSRVGMFVWSPSRPNDLDRLARLLSSEAIAPIVDSVVRLEDVPTALGRLAAGEARGKIVVTP
jgi:NADPH:quinone reductase-like Zn-dependent oxidoreductase